MHTKTLNISLPQAMITQVDRLARRHDAHRSELIREALHMYIDEYRPKGRHEVEEHARPATRERAWRDAAGADTITTLGAMSDDEIAYYEAL